MARKLSQIPIATSNGDANGHTTSAEKKPIDGNVNKSLLTKQAVLPPRSDYSRWRLLDENGRHTWHYLDDDETVKDWPQTFADKYFLNLPLNLPDLQPAKTPLDSVRNGLQFFKQLQLPSGHWGCEYGGPMFILPGLVIAWVVTDTPIPEPYRIEIKNYLHARRHPEDGGWGLHVEGQSTTFGTALNYTALRLVGVGAEEAWMIKARGTLHKLGGAVKIPHWGKFWLSLLGVCDWDIVNPLPPELWLLPDWVPFAPWRWWIHTRQVFLPMSFIWSRKWTYPTTPLILELRKELFTEPWESIEWISYRSTISPKDNYHPKGMILNTINWLAVNVWNPYLRANNIVKRGEDWVSQLIDMENENTDYSALASVNGPLNLIACYIRDGTDAYSVKRLRERMEDYVWVKDEGLHMNGTNGVMVWDTSILIHSVVDAGLAEDPKWTQMLLRALHFLDEQQIRENVNRQDECYRQQRKGGWSFSNKDQGYAVSDCVSVALKAVILLQQTPGYPKLLSDQRIYDAVDTLLTFQNASGGCSSYEPTRGSEYLETLNAAEVFGRTMVEYDYPECTTAVVTALSLFSKYYPEYRAGELKAFTDRAVAYIRKAQKLDGSWYGSWGICHTYAGMWALESLSTIGETYQNSKHSKKGCDFLLSKQRADGGWCESYLACETGTYIEHPAGSQVVHTAWACIGLMKAQYPDRIPIERGLKLIMGRQQLNGEWKQEAIEGVFNKSCMITYPNYKFTFSFKALGMFAMRYGDIQLL